MANDVTELSNILERARAYPYWAPKSSYTWDSKAEVDNVRPFDPNLVQHCWPVFAVGSNRSPQQLSRKFKEFNAGPIAVQYGRIADFDVVYAAHISAYGAVPAMLQRAPGVQAKIAITWLSDEQLDIMHHTEGNYHFGEIEHVQLILEHSEPIESAYLYVGKHGSLNMNNQAIGVQNIAAFNRPYTSANSAEILEMLRERLGASENPDNFILRLVNDDHYRNTIISILAAKAQPFDYPVNIIEKDLCGSRES